MKNNVKIEEIVVIWSFYMIIPYKTIERNEFFVKRNDIKILFEYMTSTVQFATVFMFLVIQYGSSLNLKSTKVRYKLCITLS